MSIFTILQLFPSVLGAVAAVESAAAGSPGLTKKQIILDSIQAGAKVGEMVPIPQVALVSAAIDSVVGALNANGVFAHGARPAAASTK